MNSTLRELLKSSRQSDFLVITGALDNFLQVVDDSEENLSNFLESFTSDIKKFTQLFVQDDISPLTNLHSALKIELDILREKIVKSQHPHGNTIICALSSCDTLEYLKEIARRVSYGYRSSTEIRESSHFDDQSNAALWRWEVRYCVIPLLNSLSWLSFLITFHIVMRLRLLRRSLLA